MPLVCRIRRVLGAALLAVAAAGAAAEEPRQTVCTITINSADEQEALRRHLPESRYRFVELVERGRPDWLASACRAGTRCDVLVVSAHFDGQDAFFSDRLDVDEHLTVGELERVSCNDSCPGLLDRLREVYLFGCNTLNPEPQAGARADIVRGLMLEGHSAREAERQGLALEAESDDSSRNRMRVVFDGVPVLYGFASTAPLGPVAGSVLDRYLRGGGTAEFGRGRSSPRLLAAFAPFGMTSATGVRPGDALAASRAELCQFADDRRSDADRIRFVHTLLRQSMAEARLHLDRIARVAKAAADPARRTQEAAAALQALQRDTDTRGRVLRYARELAQPSVRVRLLDVAQDLGWLGAEARWLELAQMLGELLDRRTLGIAEVDLACTLNRGGDLDGAFARRVAPARDDVAHAAVRACLGSSEAQSRVLAALTGASETDAQVAQVYLRHRPLADADALRTLAGEIGAAADPAAQVRALEALGRHHLSDRDVIERLAALFTQTHSGRVQDAIAAILVRADRRALPGASLLQALREHRLPGTPGEGMVDALIHRLQLP